MLQLYHLLRAPHNSTVVQEKIQSKHDSRYYRTYVRNRRNTNSTSWLLSICLSVCLFSIFTLLLSQSILYCAICVHFLVSYLTDIDKFPLFWEPNFNNRKRILICSKIVTFVLKNKSDYCNVISFILSYFKRRKIK
jgi:hypothetical protein